MSIAIALIRFNDGMILRGCYDGSSDLLCPWLITEKEINEKYNGSVFKWADTMSEKQVRQRPYNEIEDIEEVEIFSDYGDGSVWKGEASRKDLVVASGFDMYYGAWSDDIPDWVIEYYKAEGWDYKHLIRQIGIYTSKAHITKEIGR